IRFVYEKNGKQLEFSPSELPADLSTYTFKDRVDRLVRKGNAEPPIKGLSFRGSSGIDSTDTILSQPYAILLFCEDFPSRLPVWLDDFDAIKKAALADGIPVYVVSSSLNEHSSTKDKILSGAQAMDCDFTVIRTAARTNPCLYI